MIICIALVIYKSIPKTHANRRRVIVVVFFRFISIPSIVIPAILVARYFQFNQIDQMRLNKYPYLDARTRCLIKKCPKIDGPKIATAINCMPPHSSSLECAFSAENVIPFAADMPSDVYLD